MHLVWRERGGYWVDSEITRRRDEIWGGREMVDSMDGFGINHWLRSLDFSSYGLKYVHSIINT